MRKWMDKGEGEKGVPQPHAGHLPDECGLVGTLSLSICSRLIDWVKVLRPTRHKIGHFGDVPQANLLAWYWKTRPNTTKAHIHQSKEMQCTTTQNKQKTKARFNRLLGHPACKQRGPILVLALHKFVINLPTYDCLQPCNPSTFW